MAGEDMFGSKSLRCLVCKAIVDEFEAAIEAVDPDKKIDLSTSFHLTASGEPKAGSRKVVAYRRSDAQLHDLIDTVCKEFDEYAQAKEKSNGEATIIRIMSRSGGMNPRFSEVDIVPDEDLNTRLKFYCESIVEEYEDDLLQLFKEENDVKDELCIKRSRMCKFSKEEL